MVGLDFPLAKCFKFVIDDVIAGTENGIRFEALAAPSIRGMVSQEILSLGKIVTEAKYPKKICRSRSICLLLLGNFVAVVYIIRAQT